MKNNNTFKLVTQRVLQNNQEFLIGVFDVESILKFTRYTEYTILGFNENDNNRPITKEEIQRKLLPSKIKSIVDFLLTDPLAIFPTNLVVSIPNHVIDEQIEDDSSGIVTIQLNDKVFNEIKKIDNNHKGDIYLSIIDGQHRVKGIEEAILHLQNKIAVNENLVRTSNNPDTYSKEINKLKAKLDLIRKIQLPVTFFIDPVLEFQAMIFSTINRTQTKVSPDLVYSLFGLTKGDSPQKTVLNIVNTLNGRIGSPFYKRIRLAGSGSKEARVFYKEGNPVLSQATVVKSILALICKDKREEDIARHKSREYFIENRENSLPFRKYYGKNDDARIIQIIYAYFLAVRKTFKDGNELLWEFEEQDTRKPKNILQTTVGYAALLEILITILKELREEDNNKVEVYESYLSKASKIDFVDNNIPKKYPFTTQTKNKIINEIGEKIWGNSFEKRKILE